MNGVHDLGGMHGFGPIVREEDGRPFHAAWEARVGALMSLLRPRHLFDLDAHRWGIERMEPAHYLAASYYERWLVSIEYNLIEAGAFPSEEMETRTEFFQLNPKAPLPVRDPDGVLPLPDAMPNPPLPHLEPRFSAGDAVVARNIHPAGHTRLPRYVRGKQGLINLVHGPAVFPDTNAHGLGEHPQVVYNVRFDAHELWGESAEPRQTVSIDLWESYLDPAPE